MSTQRVAPGTVLIDVEYLDSERYIGCGLLEGDRPVIIDPGPAVCASTLERGLQAVGLSVRDLYAVLLTHIHLDHAGAAGTLVGRHPDLRVYVHERGAPHLIDPSKLLGSARQLYGDEMERLFGEFLPVPEENVVALAGDEQLDVAGRTIEVAYTPGHASHHVSFFDPTTRFAYVGDTCGIRIAGEPFVLPVTPPPDIDLQIWHNSLDVIAAWQPEQLFVTHFGPGPDAPEHIAEFRARLSDWARRVRSDVDREVASEVAIERFSTAVAGQLAGRVPADVIPLYEHGGAPDMSWHGLARYWRKRREAKA